MRGDGELEFAVVQVVVLGGGHRSGGAKLLDLRRREVAGRAAHGVEGLEDVAVIGVDAQDFDGGVGRYVLDGEVEGFGWACGAFWPGVGGAFSGGWGVVPEGEGQLAVGGFCGQGGIGVESDAAVAELMECAEDVECGLGNVFRGDEAEAAVEGRADDALLVEDIGERPIVHAVGEAVAEADGVGEPGTDEGGVSYVGLVGVAGVVLGEDEREVRIG